MKILLDFLPILLFFGTFKFAERDAQSAADFATVNGSLPDGETSPNNSYASAVPPSMPL